MHSIRTFSLLVLDHQVLIKIATEKDANFQTPFLIYDEIFSSSKKKKKI